MSKTYGLGNLSSEDVGLLMGGSDLDRDSHAET
jgi:hypothetical protein